MGGQGRKRSFKTLWALVLIAIAYCGWLYYQHTLMGSSKLDGSLGVLLGLYICSRPAANMLDMLFFAGSAGRDGSSSRSTLLWLALNLLVLFCGWNVIFIGTTRFVSRAP
jgi:hypothetical protein